MAGLHRSPAAGDRVRRALHRRPPCTRRRVLRAPPGRRTPTRRCSTSRCASRSGSASVARSRCSRWSSAPACGRPLTSSTVRFATRGAHLGGAPTLRRELGSSCPQCERTAAARLTFGVVRGQAAAGRRYAGRRGTRGARGGPDGWRAGRDGRGLGHDPGSRISPCTAWGSAPCASPARGIWGAPPDRDEAKARAARRRARRRLHRHRRLVRAGRERGADRRGAAPVPRRLVIATKGGLERSPTDAWPPDASRPPAAGRVEGSLRRLRARAHRSSTSSTGRPGRAARGLGRRARRAQARGQGAPHRALERHRGAAGAAQAIVPIVSVQNRYNLSDRRSDDVLGACERDGIAFLPWRRSSISTATVRGACDEVATRRSAPGGARVAARTVADDAADPGHRIGRPPRGERGGGGDRAVRRRRRRVVGGGLSADPLTSTEGRGGT